MKVQSRCVFMWIRLLRYLGQLVYKHFTLHFTLIFLQAAGKYRQQGRNYVVEDGDIIFFKFNTPNAPKKKP